MANTKNLRPFTSEQSREEAAKNGRKGGKKSGQARREKQQLRKAAQAVLDGTYSVDGRELTGSELIASKLMEILQNVDHRLWWNAVQLMIELDNSNMSEGELELAEAQLAYQLKTIEHSTNEVENDLHWQNVLGSL